MTHLENLPYWVLTGMCFLPSMAAAQYTYDVDDAQEQHIFVYDFIQYLEDPTHAVTFEEIHAGRWDAGFRRSDDFTPSNYVTTSSYWLKISIRHHAEIQRAWLLEFFDQTIDSIEAYVPDSMGHYRQIVLGDALPFTQRPILHKNFVIPLYNDHNQTLTYYFRVRAAHPVDLMVVIRAQPYFTYYSLNEYHLFGVYYGLLLLIALYNLLLWGAFQEPTYLYIVGYALCVALYFGSSDGFAYQYLWPQIPQWNQVAYGVFQWGTSLFAILFTQSFLHLRHKVPRLHAGLWLLIGGRTFFVALALAWKPAWLDHQWVDIPVWLFLVAVAVESFRRGYQPARLFMLAFLFLSAGIVIKLLLVTGVGHIGNSPVFYYAFHLAFLVQLITFSFALGDKVRILRQNRDRVLKRMVHQLEVNRDLQTKVNRELETKVTERTEALHASNAQLQQQAEEIRQMNRELDMRHWELQKSSIGELRRVVLSPGLAIADFQRLFPDDTRCLQHLAHEKWAQGYACRKCSYDHATEDLHFGRRCSRCGYLESVTAHTVFHNVRFPLPKAFYIAHVVWHQVPLTTRALAQTLDLREATCAAFRKKVASH